MYVDCFSLPILNYIDLISINDYKKLKRTFLPVTKACYEDANERITKHVIELSKNEKIKALNSLSEKIEYNRDKFDLLYLIGQVLELKESPEMLNMLAKMGYNASTRAIGYKSVISALKKLKIDILVLEKEYEDKKDKEPKRATSKAEYMAQRQKKNKSGYMLMKNPTAADYIQAIGLIDEEIKNFEIKRLKK